MTSMFPILPEGDMRKPRQLGENRQLILSLRAHHFLQRNNINLSLADHIGDSLRKDTSVHASAFVNVVSRDSKRDGAAHHSFHSRMIQHCAEGVCCSTTSQKMRPKCAKWPVRFLVFIRLLDDMTLDMDTVTGH